MDISTFDRDTLAPTDVAHMLYRAGMVNLSDYIKGLEQRVADAEAAAIAAEDNVSDDEAKLRVRIQDFYGWLRKDMIGGWERQWNGEAKGSKITVKAMIGELNKVLAEAFNITD